MYRKKAKKKKMNNSKELNKWERRGSFSDADGEGDSAPSRAECAGALIAENATAPVSSDRAARSSTSSRLSHVWRL